MTNIQRVAMINSNNTQKNSDYDFTKLWKRALGNKGGIENRNQFTFDTSSKTLSAGDGIATAYILCTRPTSNPIPNEQFLAQFEFTGSLNFLNITNGDKIFIEIKENLVNDPTLIEDLDTQTNYSQGLGIGEIKMAREYPNHTNYLKLYEWNNGLVDKREIISLPALDSVAQRTTSLEQKMETQEEKISQLEEVGDSDQLVAKLIPNCPVKREKYKVLCNPIPPKANFHSINDGNHFSQNIILSQIPQVEKIYISFLLRRKVDEPVQFTFEAGERGNYSHTLAKVWHTSTKTQKLVKEYDEVVFELPVNKIKNENFQVLVKYDRNKIGAVLFDASSKGIYSRFDNNSEYSNRLGLVTAFYENDIDFNLIGKNWRPGLGIGTNQCIGISMDEGEGIADLYMPTGDFEYKKGNFIARKFKTGSNTKVTALTFDGFFENHNGNTNISIYKEDALGGIDVSQRIFTTSIEKSQFALGVSEGKKIYNNGVELFNQTINFDAVVEFETIITSDYGDFRFFVDGSNVHTIEKNRRDIFKPQKIKRKIKKGQKLRLNISSGASIEYFYFTISPTGSTSKHIPIDTNLEANTSYYVVIDGGFSVKSHRGEKYVFKEEGSSYEIPNKVLFPGNWELEFKKTQSSINLVLYLWINGIFQKSASIYTSTDQSIVVPIVIDDWDKLEGKGSSRFPPCVVGWHPKQLYISTQSITNMTLERGCPYIGVEFEKPAPIKIVLNKSVIHLENKNFTPGETYYLYQDELHTLEETQAMNQTANLIKFGLALTPTSILMDIAIQSTTGVITGSVPLGMPIGYVQMNGYNVPVYG